MINKLPNPEYLIKFPGGEILYQPLEGIILDLKKKQTLFLSQRREFSVLSKVLKKELVQGSDFNPVCLTVYPSHHCNLNCTYCYIPNKETYPDEFIDPAVVESGARIVAENCKRRNLPFVVGFHGGNEPLLHPEKLEEYLTIIKSEAVRNNSGS